MAPPFCARDYADIADPVLLSGQRKAAFSRARTRTISRLINEHQDRYSQIYAEELAVVERRFQRWVERKRAEARAQRLADRRAS